MSAASSSRLNCANSFPFSEAAAPLYHRRALLDGHPPRNQPAHAAIATLLATASVAVGQAAVELAPVLGIAIYPTIDRLVTDAHRSIAGELQGKAPGNDLRRPMRLQPLHHVAIERAVVAATAMARL